MSISFNIKSKFHKILFCLFLMFLWCTVFVDGGSSTKRHSCSWVKDTTFNHVPHFAVARSNFLQNFTNWTQTRKWDSVGCGYELQVNLCRGRYGFVVSYRLHGTFIVIVVLRYKFKARPRREEDTDTQRKQGLGLDDYNQNNEGLGHRGYNQNNEGLGHVGYNQNNEGLGHRGYNQNNNMLTCLSLGSFTPYYDNCAKRQFTLVSMVTNVAVNTDAYDKLQIPFNGEMILSLSLTHRVKGPLSAVHTLCFSSIIVKVCSHWRKTHTRDS